MAKNMTDLEKLKAQMQKLQEKIDFQEQSQQKFVAMAESIRKYVADAGLDLETVLKHLKPTKTRAARGTANKAPAESVDATGAKPERGTKYKHSSWPETWTATGKRAPKHVIATVKSGKTWKSLIAK